MSLTIKQMLQAAQAECGFAESDQFANASDKDDKQIFNLANREAVTLVNYAKWSQLRSVDTITLTAATEYDLADDFGMYIPDTLWDSTSNRQVKIPTDDAEWAYLKSASISTGITLKARFEGGKLAVHSPTSGNVLRYEYTSKHAVLATDGTTTKERFTADTDTFRLDDSLLIMGVIWRFKKLKNMPDWSVDKHEYEKHRALCLGRSIGARSFGVPREVAPYNEPYTNLWVS